MGFTGTGLDTDGSTVDALLEGIFQLGFILKESRLCTWTLLHEANMGAAGTSRKFNSKHRTPSELKH